MENVIYIDELIKKISKRWKQVVVITVMIAAIMGIVGAVSVGNARKYIYQASFVINNSRYDEMADALRLSTRVFSSNDILLETSPELVEKYSYKKMDEYIGFYTYTDGTMVVILTVPEELVEDFDLAFMQRYVSNSLQMLTDEFPGISYVMLEEPYIQSQPEDWMTELVESVVPYFISGTLLGIVAGIFMVALMILWNPAEFSKK